MKLHEALRAIENGKKVRFIQWPANTYCYLDNDGDVVDQNGALLLDTFQLQLLDRDLWEEYLHEEEIPTGGLWGNLVCYIRNYLKFLGNQLIRYIRALGSSFLGFGIKKEKRE